MSSADQTHRNRWIAGLAILVVLLILVMFSAISLLQPAARPGRVGHHSIIPALTYCGSDQDRLCIISFTREVDGAMRVNFQTPHAYFPEFILKIVHNMQETSYECERVADAAAGMYCTGTPQVPGQVLQFKVISKNRGTLMAEGRFAIIGIALMTPEIISSATMELTGTPTLTPTALAPLGTPTGVQGTPTQATAGPSYPNPSYP